MKLFFYAEVIKSDRECLNLFINRNLEEYLSGKRIKFPNKLVKNIVKVLL